MGYPSELSDKEWFLIKKYFEQKRVFGRPLKHNRRHIVVHTQGHFLLIKVHAANIHDTKAGCDVFDRAKEKFRSLTQ